MFSDEKLTRLVSWLQRMVVYFALGESELPKEWVSMIRNYHKKNTLNGHAYRTIIETNRQFIANDIDYYVIPIGSSNPNLFNSMNYQDTTTLTFIASKKQWNTIRISPDGRFVTIIIPLEYMEKADENLDILVPILISMICWLCRDNFFEFNEDVVFDSLLGYTLGLTFIKRTFNVNISEYYEPYNYRYGTTIEDTLDGFIDKRASDQDVFKDIIDKIRNYDIDFYEELYHNDKNKTDRQNIFLTMK